MVHEHTVSKNLHILYTEYVTEKWKEEMSTRAVGHSIIFHWLMLINENLIFFFFLSSKLILFQDVQILIWIKLQTIPLPHASVPLKH